MKRRQLTVKDDKNEQTDNRISPFPIVEGQFDDASSSSSADAGIIAGQFEDASSSSNNQEKINSTANKKRKRAQGIPIMDGDGDGDGDEIKKTKSDCDHQHEAELNLVSFEETSPPKDIQNSAALKNPFKTEVSVPLDLRSTMAATTTIAVTDALTKSQQQQQQQQQHPFPQSPSHHPSAAVGRKNPIASCPEELHTISSQKANEMKKTEKLMLETSAHLKISSLPVEILESKMPPLNASRQIPLEVETLNTSSDNIATGKMPSVESNVHDHDPGFILNDDMTQPILENLQQNQQQQPVDQSSITPDDVLLGRGGGTNRHNTRFRQLVSEAQPQYVQARKKDKTRLAKSIVATIRSRHGRFLKLHPNGYYFDVGDKQATSKTSQALREGLSGRIREIVKVGCIDSSDNNDT